MVYNKYHGKYFLVCAGFTKGMDSTHSIERAAIWQELEEITPILKHTSSLI